MAIDQNLENEVYRNRARKELLLVNRINTQATRDIVKHHILRALNATPADVTFRWPRNACVTEGRPPQPIHRSVIELTDSMASNCAFSDINRHHGWCYLVFPDRHKANDAHKTLYQPGQALLIRGKSIKVWQAWKPSVCRRNPLAIASISDTYKPCYRNPQPHSLIHTFQSRFKV